MKISSRIWLIIFGMLLSFGTIIALLIITLNNSNQSLQSIQFRSQQWTNLELMWNQQKSLYITAQDEARDLALTANGDINRLTDAITLWQNNVSDLSVLLTSFSSNHAVINAAMIELSTVYHEGSASHSELIDAWNAKSSFQTRKLERSLESATEAIDESFSVARETFSQFLSELQTETSTSISARVTQVFMITPLVFIAVFMYAFLMLRHIRNNLKNTMRQLDDASQGNLDNHHDPKDSRDELAQMNNSVAHMQEQLTSIVEQVLNKASALQDSAAALSEHVDETLSGYDAEQQAFNELQGVYEHLTQGATRVKDLGEQVNNQSVSASQASQQGAALTQQTSQALQVLDDSVVSSMKAVEDLSESSSAISDILNVIRGIAEQTNLLALNAAIEAARAGEQGRGFAVVADEVRNLAKRTQDSTMEIETLVQHLHTTIEGVNDRTQASQTEAKNVQSLAAQVEIQFKEIEIAVDTIRQTSIGNTELSQEQATSMYEANSNLESMTHQSRHRKTQVEDLAENALALNQISEELRTVMKFFKLNGQHS